MVSARAVDVESEYAMYIHAKATADRRANSFGIATMDPYYLLLSFDGIFVWDILAGNKVSAGFYCFSCSFV